ncbi:S8 family serine peptidase [Microbacterium sp. X-17]|uniref:S8 family serine peptidase n=1 Tax=Microbacterium sp. X-17 TaxID=3144404 RepID=UPI0031F51CCC
MRRTTRLAAAVLALASIAALGAAASPPAVSPSSVSPSSVSTPASPSGDPVQAAEYWLNDYGIRDAWQVTRGAGTKIAIIDTGIGQGPVFAGVVAGTDESTVGSPDGRTPVGTEDPDHGSWVASLAAGRGTGGGAGMLGVAPDADLLSVSLGFGGSSPVSFTKQVAAGIRWAVDHGADVINLSFTTNTLGWDPSWDDAFLYAFDHDVVVVVAAGNRGSGTDVVGAPATIPGVLTVAGVTPLGAASVEASTQGIVIGISAPSEQLLGVSANGQVVVWNGTSGAAPIIAGVAALVRAAHPDLNAANVINRIIATARPASGQSHVPDAQYGYGLVDASAAVGADVPLVSANPMGDLSDWIRVYRRAAAVTPTPTASPLPVEALPAPDTATSDLSPLLPSYGTFVYGSVPLLALTVPAILVALGVTAAVRRIRSARDSRSPHK